MAWAVKWETSDESTLARTVRLSLATKQLLGPRRALTAADSKFCEAQMVAEDSTSLSEFVPNLSYSRILELESDPGELGKFSSSFENVLGASPGVRIGYFNLPDESKGIGTDQLDLLSDLLSTPANDILATPLPTGIMDMDLVKHALQRLEKTNKVTTERPIMGVIPYTSRKMMQKITQYYIGRGLQLFGLDFQGKSPIYPNVTAIQILLHQYAKDSGRDVYVHGFNMPAKRGNAAVIPAIDIPFVGLGVDSYGRNHVQPKGSAGYSAAKIRARQRIFRAADYGYLNQQGIAAAIKSQETLEWDSAVARKSKLADLFAGSVQELQRTLGAHNCEKISVELDRVRKAIAKKELGPYLETKRQAEESVRDIENAAQAIKKQGRL